MRWKPILRDVLIVLGLTFLGGFVVGFTAGVSGKPAPLEAIAISNLVFGILGFVIVGCLNATAAGERFQHLSQVAVGVWLCSLVNVAFGVTIPQWFAAGGFILFLMGVGGGISLLIVRPQPPRAEE